MGRRLSKRVGDSITYFLYAPEGLIGEYNALGQETAAYGWRPDGIWGTDPLFYKLGSRYFYAHTDHLGTPLKLTDRAGSVVWAARYTAFGQASVATGSTVIYNLRLPGQYFDQETGLHYNCQRDYDSQVGRYLEEDPIGLAAGMNSYAYVNGNPLTFVDPVGLDLRPCLLASLQGNRRVQPEQHRHELFSWHGRHDTDLASVTSPRPAGHRWWRRALFVGL